MSALWHRMRLRLCACALGVNFFAQVGANGGDSALLGAIAASMNCACALLIFLVARPTASMLRKVALPLALFTAGLLWATWPDIHTAWTGGYSERIAPDLVPSAAAQFLGTLLLLIGAAVLGSRGGQQRFALTVLTVCGVANLVLGLLLRQLDPNSVWGTKKGILAGRFTGTMLNANAMGTIYAMIAVLALALLLTSLRQASGSPRRHPLILFALLIVFAALLGSTGLTGSRTALGCGILASLILTLRYFLRVTKRPVNMVGLWVGIGTVAGMLVLGSYVTMRRLPRLGDDALRRWDLWQHYADIADRADAHGYGLGSFSQVNLAQLPQDSLATIAWYVNSAHNIVLQMMIEGGALFALLTSLGVGLIVIFVIRHWPHRRDPMGLLQLGSMLALGIVLAGGMVDIALNVPADVTLAASLLGLAWGRAIRLSDRHRLSRGSRQRCGLEHRPERLASRREVERFPA